jgi:hypothetical protein
VWVTVLLAAALAPTPLHADEAASTLHMVQRLSYRLRGPELLKAEEWKEIHAELAQGKSPDVIYDERLARWLGPEAIKGLLAGVVVTVPMTKGSGRVFPRGTITAFRHADGREVFYSPALTPTGKSPPCTPSEAVAVHPWWNPSTAIPVCPDSYHPEKSFDEVGYCGSDDQAINDTPARPGCGCGPFLMACLPPKAVLSSSDIDSALNEEILQTLTDVVVEDRSVDEWLTTTRTWQTGLVELVYLVRELRGALARERWSSQLESRLLAKLQAGWVDPLRPGRWVERPNPYTGSGLLFTPPAMTTRFTNYRQVAVTYLESFLCSEFSSVRVDAEAVLKAVGAHHQRLTFFEPGPIAERGRGKNPLDAPMRHIEGCKGCHGPLDNVAASLRVIALHVYGGYPNKPDTGGALFVKGANDTRGAVEGLAQLNQLVVKQPEFGACMVERTFESLVGARPLSRERPLLDEWTRRFESSGHRLRSLLMEMLRYPGVKLGTHARSTGSHT